MAEKETIILGKPDGSWYQKGISEARIRHKLKGEVLLSLLNINIETDMNDGDKAGKLVNSDLIQQTDLDKISEKAATLRDESQILAGRMDALCDKIGRGVDREAAVKGEPAPDPSGVMDLIHVIQRSHVQVQNDLRAMCNTLEKAI